VLIGNTTLQHSLDGVSWTEVHEFEDLEPPGVGSPPAMNPAGGGAGFVVPVIDGSSVAPVARYFWSADGITWSEHSLPGDVEFLDSAVSDDIGMVIPLGHS
jgi:hypothetical protein